MIFRQGERKVTAGLKRAEASASLVPPWWSSIASWISRKNMSEQLTRSMPVPELQMIQISNPNLQRSSPATGSQCGLALTLIDDRLS